MNATTVSGSKGKQKAPIKRTGRPRPDEIVIDTSKIAVPAGYAVVFATMKTRAQKSKTVEGLIKAIGGPLAVSRTLGIDHSSISQWISMNVLPKDRVQQIATYFDLPEEFVNTFTRQ